MNRFYRITSTIGKSLESPFLLLIRLVWGWAFFMTGLGKLQDIQSVAGFFSNLGLPFPSTQAFIVGLVEMLGGLLLIFGLFSRIASLALICVMIAALYFVNYDVVSNFFNDIQKIFVLQPFSFLFACLVIFIFGAGKFSLDYLFERK